MTTNATHSTMHALVHADGSAEVTFDGERRELDAGPFENTRSAIGEHAAVTARRVSSPVQVLVSGADGGWEFVVGPDSSVTDVHKLDDATTAERVAALHRSDVAAPEASHSGEAGPDDFEIDSTEIDDMTIPRVQPTLNVPPVPVGPVPTQAPITRAPFAPVSPPSFESMLTAPSEPSSPAETAPQPANPTRPVPTSADSVPVQTAPTLPAPPLPGPPAAIPQQLPPTLATPLTMPPATPQAPPSAEANPAAASLAPAGAASPGSWPGVQAPDLASATHPAPTGLPTAMAAPIPTHAPTPSYDPSQRPSFLRTETREEPAQTGFRGLLSRVGISMAPSEAELRIRDDERTVSQHWPGPRTIAIVNGKGGASKTPTTILLSAVFAKHGGAGVLAWDNNQTRGTLGWRTERGPHDATLLELLPETERLLGPGAQAADLAHFVHHQAQDKYDVLRSKPMKLAHENRLSPEDVDSIHAVAAKYYRLIVIDSGNDESDPMWGRMIDHADQIVLATTTRADHAEAGALLLEALAERDERSANLARNSVVVVSQADRTASREDVDKVVSGYQALSRTVARIPFDPSMVDGHLRHGALQPETQRAWLAAAAAVARGL